AFELLRAREIGCANESLMRLVHFSSGVSDCLGESEVNDFDVQLRRLRVASGQHDVSGFEIAMDQTVGGRGTQRARDLDRNCENEFYFKRTLPADTTLQSFTLDQLHRVIAAAAIRQSTELEDSGHIRMSQSRGRAGFAQKSFTHGSRA